ncbi:hypothetical protein ACFZBC_31920 [Streptomyces luteogriseus]|uniref:hypothetical protein n=1 Tax=Streptomyces luteogriseus TaxID=68233 RepID=UPI0036E5225D
MGGAGEGAVPGPPLGACGCRELPAPGVGVVFCTSAVGRVVHRITATGQTAHAPMISSLASGLG